MAALSRLPADVRTNELNLSATLVQNSNTTAAAIMVSDRGPIGPKLYTSYQQIVDDFGPADSKKSFDQYALNDFFREGSAAWVTRVVGAGATYGVIGIGSNGSGAASIQATVPTAGALADPELVSFADPTLFPSAGGTPFYLFYCRKGPGVNSANISIRIKSRNLASPAINGGGTSATGGILVGPANYKYKIAAVNEFGQEFLSSTSSSRTLGSTTSTGSVQVRWLAVPGAVAYRIYGRNTSDALYYLTTVGEGAATDVTGSDSRLWVDTGAIAEDSTQLPIAPTDGNTSINNRMGNNPVFTLEVYDSTRSTVSPVESFECSVTDQTDELGMAMETTQRVNAFSEYIRVVSNWPALPSTTIQRVYSIPKTALGAGAAGSTPTTSDMNAGWARFLNKERYVIDVLINAGRASPTIQNQMDYVARTRNDCVAFLDLPSLGQSMGLALDYRRVTLNLNSSYSALFGSDLYEEDVTNGKLLYVPPSGAMAGLQARTSRTDYPYRSIAGLNRGLTNALDIRYSYSEAEATQLVQAQINYTRKFLGKGIPLWEQWTLASQASALQFLNVRVLLNVIKRSTYDFLIYGIQEPNDEVLRKQLVFGLEQYLDYVAGTRGISFYQVTANKSNNPASVVNSGTLNIFVYMVPIQANRGINLTLGVGQEGLTITESDIAKLGV